MKIDIQLGNEITVKCLGKSQEEALNGALELSKVIDPERWLRTMGLRVNGKAGTDEAWAVDIIMSRWK